EETEESPEQVLLRQEQEAEFLQFLAQLPPQHRSVLLLHYIEDFSLEQIATITDSQLGTVKSRMHYAKKSLRKLMEGKQ
ncbi:MAG TPA: RNA polymerase sigma factor, partial [Candidatus Saccharimonadales bacterium]|nr:RNA polymerase sigma factor [Candidatus Saccharimonadales bacterium]